MTSMREKIAHRLVHLYEQNDGPLDGLTEADAVLEALTEPTAGMQYAALPFVARMHLTRAIFTTMIQAARDGK